jgi:GNAT superfamily N-acetyltransferase
MLATVTISDLRDVPQFFDTVADRIWQAWWKRHGVSLDHIIGRLRENLGAAAMPLALVAHDGDTFAGTASLISSDLDERPHYTPWVAAVWVEPAFRGRSLSRALVDRAAAAGFAMGHRRIYLCAAEPRRALYEKLGWTPIEEGVGGLKLTVFVRDRGPE